MANTAQSETDTDSTLTALFSESNARLLVEIRPADQARFEARFAGLPLARLGEVTREPRLTIGDEARPAVSLPLEQLCAAWLAAE